MEEEWRKWMRENAPPGLHEQMLGSLKHAASWRDRAIAELEDRAEGRIQVSPEAIEKGVTNLQEAIESALYTKGRGAFVSSHEAFGVIAEEVSELAEALRKGDAVEFAEEAVDVAIAAVFAVASLQAHFEAGRLDRYFSR